MDNEFKISPESYETNAVGGVQADNLNSVPYHTHNKIDSPGLKQTIVTGSGTQDAITVKEDGAVKLTNPSALNFTGDVTVTNAGGGQVNIDVVGGSGSGAINFTDLLDVPTSYTGQSGKTVSVKSDESGLEFTTETVLYENLISTTSLNASDVYDTHPIGQTFTPTASHILTDVTLNLNRIGTAGTITVGVYATSGGFPTGVALTSISQSASTILTTGRAWYNFSLSPVHVNSGTLYAIVVFYDSTLSDEIQWFRDDDASYLGGTDIFSTNDGSTWNNSNSDTLFKEIGLAVVNVTENEITLSDVTTLNVSTTKHGLAPKSPNDATRYLDGSGNYSTPAGSANNPAGSDKNIQFNDGGTVFGGITNNTTATNKYLQQVNSGTPSFEQPAEIDLTFTDVATNNVTSTKHGLTPKSPANASKFLNGATTPDYAQVKDSDLSLSDITTNDVSITSHGFVPKAPNDTSKFLRGDGNWSSSPGVNNAFTDLTDVPISYSSQGGKTVSVKNDESGLEFTSNLSTNIFGTGGDGSKIFNGSSTVFLNLGGSLIPSGNVYTLTRDIYLNDCTVNSGVTIDALGYRIFVKGNLINNNILQANGNDGGDGGDAGPDGAGNPTVAGVGGIGATATSGSIYGGFGGADGGDGGAGIVNNDGGGHAANNGSNGIDNIRCINPLNGINGSNGGTGGGGGGNGGGGGGAGGVGGTSTLATILPYTITNAISLHEIIDSAVNFLTTSGGAAGGGGGGGGGAQSGSTTTRSGAGGGGGGGGATGGILFIAANTILNSGTIQANGGVGGRGGNGGDATHDDGVHAVGGGAGGAGGTGGNGGVVILIYNSYTNTGTVQAVGGVGGNHGNIGSGQHGGNAGGSGTTGNTGNDGVIITIQNS